MALRKLISVVETRLEPFGLTLSREAVETFLTNDVQSQLEYTVPIDYVGDGLVIKLKG